MLSHQMWMIANKCNLSCTYCYFETGRYPYRSADVGAHELRAWLECCTALDPVETVSFTGGEPLLRTDLMELVHAASAWASQTTIFTNAVAVTDELACMLAEAGVRTDVSVDHVSENLTDQVRGGTKATLEGIERLQTAGVGGQIVFVLTSLNWRELAAVGRTATRADWDFEVIPVAVPSMHPLSLSNLDAQQRGEIVDLLDEVAGLIPHRKCFVRLQYVVQTGRLPQVLTCRTGQEGIFVNSNGTISVCGHRSLQGLGNVRDLDPAQVKWAKMQELERRAAGPCVSRGCLSLT